MILTLLASVGLTFIIKDGRIFEGIRSFLIDKFGDRVAYLLSCPMCLGFWCGIIWGLISYTEIIPTMANGFATSFCAFIFNVFIIIAEHFISKE